MDNPQIKTVITTEDQNMNRALIGGAVFLVIAFTGWILLGFQSRLNRMEQEVQSNSERTRSALAENASTMQKGLTEIRDSMLKAASQANTIAVTPAVTPEDSTPSARTTTQPRRRSATPVKTRPAVDQNAKMVQQLSQSQARLAEELNKIKQDTGSDREKLASVTNDVASVKTDLDRTTSDLRSAVGDLGVQSGLIATNSQELAALRALGDRDYHEFQLTGNKERKRVDNVVVRLKKSDVKRNRFTLELVADDKVVEKKDKNLNEPIQFYLASSRQPYEIVINQVDKNKVVGYLSSPKVTQARR